MMKVITAVATAGLLVLSGPALADRDDKQSFHRAAGSTHAAGPAHRDGKRLSGHREEGRGYDRDRQGNNHQGNQRGDRHDGKGRHDNNGRYDNQGRHDNGRGHDDRGYHGKPEYHKPGHDKHDKYHHRPVYRPEYRPAYRPHYKPARHEYRHKHHWRPAHYHYGYRWTRLPSSFVRISFGGLGFFYSDGIFYRPFESGYVVAPAPIGAVVRSLPGTAVSVVFGGRNYYVAYDTYYLWDGPRGGYQIVANPGFY